ncbi:FCD domain-containing protein [Diaminobutyricimonas sp. TR449]|nr:FCD domain-containing protein [Diaminobutyricimonas sp. TR449]
MSFDLHVRPSRAQDVADRLLSTIEKMQPGDRLGTKDELRLQAGVAAGTMNEAIRLLQSRHVISLRTGPRGGVFVASPDPLVRISDALIAVRAKPETVMDAVALRAVVDPLTVVEASRYRTAKDIRALRAQVQRMRDAIDDDLLFVRSNWAFHELVIGIGRNEILKNVALGLLEIISSNTVNVVPGSKRMPQKQERVRVHEAIVDAIESGDEEACRRASIEHSLEANLAR